MKLIQLSTSAFAKVDDDTYDYILKFAKDRDRTWTKHNRGYACIAVPKRIIMMHHLVHTPLPYEETDHINGDKLDNQRQNLRSATHQLNMMNAFAKDKRIPSIAKGVYICGSGRYVATLIWNKKREHLGTFDTLKEATIRYRTEYESRVREKFGNEIANQLIKKKFNE